MRVNLILILLSIFIFVVFVLFSYMIAKEKWQQVDFDTTVKIQDSMPKGFDEPFSFLSVLGSAEVTLLIIAVFMAVSLVQFNFLAIVGWSLIVPATIIEIFGKLFLFHPGPPVLFHRTITATHLPSFYIHTNFSYPSGHTLRTIFILTILFILLMYSSRSQMTKIIGSSLLLGIGIAMCVTRVYLGEHWVSDVVGGGLLGLSAGLFAAALMLKPVKFKPLQEV